MLKVSFDCPVCLDQLEAPMVFAACPHSICQVCWETIFDNKNIAPCPLCRSNSERDKCAQNIALEFLLNEGANQVDPQRLSTRVKIVNGQIVPPLWPRKSGVSHVIGEVSSKQTENISMQPLRRDEDEQRTYNCLDIQEGDSFLTIFGKNVASSFLTIIDIVTLIVIAILRFIIETVYWVANYLLIAVCYI